MKQCILICLVTIGVALSDVGLSAQPYNIQDFDPAGVGPWSAIPTTTTGVAKVPNGSVVLDGNISADEYGHIPGVTVTPGDPDAGGNAWILNFPGGRSHDGPEDSSFTFWLAHDDDYLYVGAHVKDDVVNSDDPNGQFWRDDSIEIVTDVFFDRFDNNTDNSQDEYGGHSYLNYEGRFSRWNEDTGAIDGTTWANAVEWTYGESGDVFGKGGKIDGGWQMEARFHKRMFDPDGSDKLKSGHRIGFNIGVDDDDNRGGPANEAPEDLEIQYFWANRARTQGWTTDEYDAGFYTDQEIAYGAVTADAFYTQNVIDGAGRLAHGGTGEIIFGFDPPAGGGRPKILFLTSNAVSPINSDPHLIALFEASGYDVTVFAPAAGSAEAAQATRDAAAEVDLVFISETIGSTSVVFDDDADGPKPPTFVLKDTDVPVISCEAYMFDDADWTAREVSPGTTAQFIAFGNSGRPEPPSALRDKGRTSLFIQSPNHRIAGGRSGEVMVYDWPYSLNWGNPSADAEVVASILADGTFPTTFVYDKGDKLVDGSVAPNVRIGLFFGQAAESIVAEGNTETVAGAPRWHYLSEAGREQLINAVNYASSFSSNQAEAGFISGIQLSGDSVIIEGSGTISSSSTVDGPYEGSIALPATIRADKSAQFFKPNP
jgi:hypothetical protein